MATADPNRRWSLGESARNRRWLFRRSFRRRHTDMTSYSSGSKSADAGCHVEACGSQRTVSDGAPSVGFRRRLSSSFRRLTRRRNSSKVDPDDRPASDYSVSSESVFDDVISEGEIDDLDSRRTVCPLRWDYDGVIASRDSCPSSDENELDGTCPESQQLPGQQSANEQQQQQQVEQQKVEQHEGSEQNQAHIRRARYRLAMERAELTASVNKEYAYCQTLAAVCNPLGATDSTNGYNISELTSHIQKIFNIDDEIHSRCLKAVQSTKPSNVCVCVTVIEARDLKPSNSNAICDPYCIVQVKSANRNTTPKSSPQGSPKAQRKTTPPRRHSSIRIDGQFGFKETHVIKGTTNPRWNVEMELPVTDIQTDELFVSIWDESINNSDNDSIQKPVLRNRHSLRNIFRSFHKMSGERLDGCLGQFKVAIKDIPVLGSERWYDLYEDSKYRKHAQGQCKLKLQLKARLSTENAESDQCSSEDFFYVVQRVYRHAMEELASQSEQSDNKKPVFEGLPHASRLVLAQFAAQNHFSTMSQIILELSVLLEAYCDSQCPCLVSDTLIRDTIAQADTLWTNKQLQDRCHEIQGVSTQKELFTKTEVSLLEQMTLQYLDQIAERVYQETTFPKTFPPVEVNIDELKSELGFSKPLLSLCHKITNSNTKNRLTELLKERIQADCQSWWNRKLQCIKSVDRDAVISEAKIFTGVIREAIEHCTPSTDVSQYFLDFNIDYEKTVIIFLEKKIAAKAQEVMLRIDSYQQKFSRYRSNILNSSIASQTLFTALKKFVEIAKSHFTTRDLYRITIINYQDWFKQAVTYWLQTFRQEGIRRVVKALDIEKDVVQVTEGVKISNSAVDVVANLHKICMEWKEIDFKDADISLLGATKITELICDGITRYLEKIEHILENNGYYDFIDNSQFDVTDQLCITLNNIVHVIRYIERLSELLEWDKVCQDMAIKYEDQLIADRCRMALERLVNTTRSELVSRAKSLWSKVMELMERDLEMYIRKFTQCQPNKMSSVDGLLEYLKTNLAVLHKKLDQFIVPSVVEDLWNKTIAIFSKTLMSGQHPDYYRQMHNHLDSLCAYFEEVGLSSSAQDCEIYRQLVDTLTLHYTPTSELLLQYYNSLTSSAMSPAAYYGHLEVKVAYKVDDKKAETKTKSKINAGSLDEVKMTDNNNDDDNTVVNVYINVLCARKLPSMSEKAEKCNPFITLALCPTALFPINRDLRTPTVWGTVDPIFDVTYQYQGIPLSLLQCPGCVLILSVWHSEDILPCNQFLGEVIIPLNTIPQLEYIQCIEDIPAMICPLTQPMAHTEPAYKVLLERQGYDKLAREMIKRRQRDTGMTTNWPVCKPLNYILQLVHGGQRVKVKGQPTISAPVL